MEYGDQGSRGLADDLLETMMLKQKGGLAVKDSGGLYRWDHVFTKLK